MSSSIKSIAKQEAACWRAHREDEKKAAAAAKEQMTRMFDEQETEERVNRLANDIPEYQANASKLTDRKSAARKRRENKEATKKSTAEKAKTARAEYNAQVEQARKAGKKVSQSAGKGVRSLEKKAKHVTA